MTQKEQANQARLFTSVMYLLGAIVAVFVGAIVAGYHITPFDVIGVCLGSCLAFPFIYWMTRESK